MSNYFNNMKNNSWAYDVKKGDYVMVVSNINKLDKRLMKATSVTAKSIFIGEMQFSKFTKSQKNNKRRIEPFLAHHIKKGYSD